MRRRTALLALASLYVALLTASHLVRRQAAGSPAPPAGVRVVETDNGVRVAYRHHAPAGVPVGPPVVLLHGSPGSSRDFSTLGPALAERSQVIAPDLPGFGYSTRRIRDYSIRAHAAYVWSLLDRLDIDSAHLVGFSMGGGVALEMARQAPHRLRSVTLLSSIGVQELELLGDYRLNHAIHGLQLAAIYLVHEGIPHFGALDAFPLGIAYARNFFDTDQRPLRSILEALAAPTLIIHGRRDVLVPATAAREHFRIVPHSELVLYDADHFMVFRDGDMLSRPISDFLVRVEKHEAPTRAQAEPQRLEMAEQPFSARGLPAPSGMALALLMLLLALATFASEDLASIGTGLLVAQGRIGFFAGVVACVLGILVGDLAIYLGGRLLGRPWLGRAPLRWVLSPNAVERSSAWFARKGPSIIFASRFLPGTRVATYFAAGLLAAGFWRFLLYLVLAVVVWVPLIVGAAALLGSQVFELFDDFARFALPGVLALAVVAWLAFRTVRAVFTHRGRRLLVGRWRRARNWEFWPRWLFYPPVVLHILRLAWRHRNPTVFTAANPAMPAGGFVGESKSAILAGIDQRFVARYRRLPGDLSAADKLAALERFLSEEGLGYPVVLKPDVGERGIGVVVVEDRESAARYLEAATDDLLAQEFVPGVELGVFYYRLPGADRGRVFSVTQKQLPVVVGDGSTTVENLVLGDERAVAMASVYLDGLSMELERIPARGERVRLVDVGTHCRGAVFLDGHRFQTAGLEYVIEEISSSYDGFAFGRYDLKAPSWDAFERGEGIKVIELNGVTSEATHIYDPKNSLTDAYRVLFRQWELAFEIGALNARNGAPVTSAWELARLVMRS